MKTSELISTIVIVLLVTIFFTLKSKKQKDSSWKGELIKKRDITDEDNENHVYKLIFKTDDGKKAKITVKGELYEKTNVGDRYEKIAGEYTPKKIS